MASRCRPEGSVGIRHQQPIFQSDPDFTHVSAGLSLPATADEASASSSDDAPSTRASAPGIRWGTFALIVAEAGGSPARWVR